MGLLADGATLAYDQSFRRICAAAGAYVASEVLQEADTTPRHDLRHFFASQVIRDPEGFERHFAWVCAVDPDIAALGTTVTSAHEGAVMLRIQNLWTWLAAFYYGESFPEGGEGEA